MARKRKPLPLLENITIEAVAAEGKCITRVDEQVIFVPFCVPGDVVDLQVVKKKHKYCEAKVVRFIKKSEVRQEPMCEHFGICGGCKWQNLPYEEQIKAKQKQVEDQLTRIGKIELPEFRPIMGSVKTQEYRNKIEFGCSNKRWFTAEELAQLPQKEDDTVTSLKERHAQNAIGFHITGAFDKIYPIKKCWLMDDLCNEIRNFVFEYADSHDYTFYDLREQHGLLRNMMIRNSNTGEWMLVFQFHYDEEGDEQRALELMQQVADKFPQITSLMYVDNQKGNDTINDLELSLFKGNDHIYELMEDLKFKVGPKSFYQTNTEQAYHLYCVAREFANLTGDELVYDLYTGTGTIANFVAHKAKKVIGIEYVPEAIEDAKMDLAAVQVKAANFVQEFAGVQSVTTNTQLLLGDWNERTAEFRNGTHHLNRGDLIVTLQPGWRVIQDEKSKNVQLVRNNAVLTPLVFFGNGLSPQRIYREVKATEIAPSVTHVLRIRPPNASKEMPLKELTGR